MSRRFGFDRCTAVLAFALLTGAVPPVRAAVAPYRPPTPQVRTLPNGLTIAVFPDHRLAIVQAALLIPAGTTQEGPREVGIGSLTSATLTRGTSSRTADQLDAELARRGATLAGSAGREYATVSLGMPSRDFESGFELLADVALNPVFPEEEIDVARTHLLQQIAAGRQNAGTIADEHAIGMALADAAGHPVTGTFETLTELHRAEVQAFHRRCYRPDRALLGVAGDVDPERVFALATTLFGSWSGKTEMAPPARFATGGGPRVRIVDLPGRAQAEFRLVMPSPGRADTASLPAAEVLAALLEGGRDSRGRVLPREERVNPVALGGSGLLMVSGTAPADSVAARIRSVRAALTALARQPIDAAALDAARRRVSGSSALPFETLAGVLGEWMAARTAGLAHDQPARFADRLAVVDGAAIARVAGAAVDARDPVVVVAGPASRLRGELAALGTVEVVTGNASAIAVPAAPSRATAAPTADEVAAGKRLVGQAVTAHGGAAKLDGIKDSVVEADATLSFQGRELNGTLKETRKDPDRFLASMLVRANLGQQGLEGRRGWVFSSAMGDTVLPADSATVAGLQAALQSDVVHLLRLAADPKARVAARGRENLTADRPSDVVEVVDARGVRRVLFLDPGSHRVIGLEQDEGSFGGNLPVRRLFSDHREVSGVLWPFSEIRTVRGERLMTIQARSVRLNTGVPDGTFSPPARGAATTTPQNPPRIRR